MRAEIEKIQQMMEKANYVTDPASPPRYTWP